MPATPFRPNPSKLLATVRALAANTGSIGWSAHARERGLERGIVDLMAIEVLRGGSIKGSIEAGNKAGEWKIKIVKALKTRRELGVVIILFRERRIFIKTVEWED